MTSLHRRPFARLHSSLPRDSLCPETTGSLDLVKARLGRPFLGRDRGLPPVLRGSSAHQGVKPGKELGKAAVSTNVMIVVPWRAIHPPARGDIVYHPGHIIPTVKLYEKVAYDLQGDHISHTVDENTKK